MSLSESDDGVSPDADPGSRKRCPFAATALGQGTSAHGAASTALGHGSYAFGDDSTAMGSGTFAMGDHSTTMGSGTVTNAYGSSSAVLLEAVK